MASRMGALQRMRSVRWALVGALCLCSLGCASTLQFTRLGAAARASGNVVTFFTVDDGDGKPVTGLHAQDFALYEDGRRLAPVTARPTLVDPTLAATHSTLLLVDMGTSARAGDQLEAITRGVRDFVRQVSSAERVAVYAFDGARSVYEILPFAAHGSAALHSLERLRTFEMRDPATNLNGAVLQSLTELERELRETNAPLQFGTLVLFTDGSDRANRVPYQQVIDAIEASPNRVYALGMGHEVDDSMLSRLGKNAYLRIDDTEALGIAFQQIADQIVRFARRQYLLSYCSDAPPGPHTLGIEATFAGERGRLIVPFTARPDGSVCDAAHPAPLDLSARPGAP